MTNYKNWPDANIDLLVGGTPCQSFSIAGLRKGLDDPRGNLMLTYLAIAERYRPKWLVWENVPGVLSSNEGRDFGTFLQALGQLRYGYSYRVLDAQYFGVAQRRRRVFVVGHLGSWQRAAAVLLERSCLSGHPAPSREARKGTAANAEASVGAGSADLCGTLGTEMSKQVTNQMLNQPESWFHPVLMRQREGKDGGGKGPLISEEKSLTLATSNDQVPAQPVAFDTYNQTINQHTSQTLGSSASDVNHYGAVLQPVAFRKSRRAQSVDDHETWIEDGITKTLNCHDVGDIRAVDIVAQPTTMQVRRLTPIECERLQGFPDNFTRIPWKKKPAEDCPDGPRYKALGNSMAVPCMRWIGERIDQVNKIP
jgi:DNA (cytosine-5)-methyltransferase 1